MNQGGKSDGWCRVVANLDQSSIRQKNLHEEKVDPNPAWAMKSAIRLVIWSWERAVVRDRTLPWF
jgi:hypothetical protein